MVESSLQWSYDFPSLNRIANPLSNSVNSSSVTYTRIFFLVKRNHVNRTHTPAFYLSGLNGIHLSYSLSGWPRRPIRKSKARPSSFSPSTKKREREKERKRIDGTAVGNGVVRTAIKSLDRQSRRCFIHARMLDVFRTLFANFVICNLTKVRRTRFNAFFIHSILHRIISNFVGKYFSKRFLYSFFFYSLEKVEIVSRNMKEMVVVKLRAKYVDRELFP